MFMTDVSQRREYLGMHTSNSCMKQHHISSIFQNKHSAFSEINLCRYIQCLRRAIDALWCTWWAYFIHRRRLLPSQIRCRHRRKGPSRDPLLPRVRSCGRHRHLLPSVRGTTAGESDEEVQQPVLSSSCGAKRMTRRRSSSWCLRHRRPCWLTMTQS